ncbi:MAG: type II toxin-antitoxin system VapC family toxin [Pseudanabaena sp.]|jgi:predicted nucleic acid-binding protein|nr:VapC toxin family PIN domain ribonuclease [Pseudanabaena sp.]
MIIVDTGFWLALIDEGDPYHQKAVMALEKYNNEPLITTWCVITETTYLLLSRLGTQAAINFIESLHQGFFTIFPLENTHTSRIIELMKKYADLPMDLADASLVVLAEHLGHGKIFSVDQRDFNTYRWKERHPFTNLLI